MKLQGQVIYWHPTRHFGVVQCKKAVNGGYTLAKYFLHQLKINFMMGEPHIDSFVRFERSQQAPKSADMLWEAQEAELYETLEQLQAAEKGGSAVQS